MSKRKRYIIDPEVQWSIARRIAMHWIAFFMLFIVASLAMQILLTGYQGSVTATLWSAAAELVPALLVMVALLPIFVRDTFRLTNRFAGPMYRLRTGLQAIANQENARPIKFRDDDFWRPVADEYNQVLDRVNQLQSRCDANDQVVETRETIEV